MIITNSRELTAHGNVAGRAVVLDILEAGLRAPDPYHNVRALVRVESDRLLVGRPEFAKQSGQPTLAFDLATLGRVFIIGAGKAVQRMAEALEDALGDLISDGQINAKKGDAVRLKRIPLILAGHPLPDEDSVRGAQRMLDIARQARKGDIVFSLDSGGGTALSALPAPGISLADLQTVYRVLYFGCGASMPAANAVRNHLALVNTKHARYVGDATFINIGSAEVPPLIRPHVYEQPTHLSGHEAAIQVLRSFHCWDAVPQSVRDFLLRADPQYGPYRPEESAGKPHYGFRVMGPEYMLAAAERRAQELGLNTLVLAQSLNDIEAAPVARALAHMAHECEVLGRPLRPPCALFCGGELTVATGEATGRGGRNQEFALATAARIASSANIVIASVDSEGTDGPTDAAGGIVDGQTLGRVRSAGFDLAADLENHNSATVLEALGDTIITGVRGVNVRDLRVIYVAGPTSG